MYSNLISSFRNTLSLMLKFLVVSNHGFEIFQLFLDVVLGADIFMTLQSLNNTISISALIGVVFIANCIFCPLWNYVLANIDFI